MFPSLAPCVRLTKVTGGICTPHERVAFSHRRSITKSRFRKASATGQSAAPVASGSQPLPLQPARCMKLFFLKIFTWWNGQTFGTQLWTWRFGELVGEDE